MPLIGCLGPGGVRFIEAFHEKSVANYGHLTGSIGGKAEKRSPGVPFQRTVE